jgi:hypothetical protein
MDEVPGVQFATVYFTRKKHDEVARIVRGRRWRQPVAVDQDGAIANLYGIGGCPITLFVKKGGIVAKSVLGNITEGDLRTRAERLQ